jgi:acetyl-CoA carboxylase carboxyl transferase subunit alpha
MAKTQVARHPDRPHCLDYVSALITTLFRSQATATWRRRRRRHRFPGRFRGESICVIGHEKASSTEGRLRHNFGMARPEAIARPSA